VDKSVARTLAVAAIKSTTMLTQVLPRLKDQCPSEEYEAFRSTIAGIAGDISIDILGKIFAAHPDLERQLDEAIRDGRTLPDDSVS